MYVQALHHEKYGYYQQKKEKIGTGGDFITSPEISQLFGEMVGIWCLATWEKMGHPAEINLVELGPGNGTLMKDTLNIVKNFPEFHKALRVSMVEISPAMRDLQRIALECTDVTSSTNEGSGSVSSNGEMDESLANDWAEQTEAECMSATTKGGIPIAWYNYLKHVPAGPSLYVGHEILDAFPVHQFSKTAEQGRWRETMVDVDFDEKSPFHFRFVKTPTITPALRIFFNKTFTGVSHQPLSTQHSAEGSSDLSGELSPEKSGQSSDHALSTKNLEGLEISPLAFSTVEEIAQNVVKHKGAALLIDYGEPYPQVCHRTPLC
jgi:NADH dehydrogenase [ubiquinone] 1 alpha subcomplex assembly factor 7